MIKRHKRRRGINDRGEEREDRLSDPSTTAPLMANKPSGRLGSLQPKPELSAETTARVELEGDHEGATK